MPISNYASMVTEAEKAVAALKDPRLKQVAFQKILESMLIHAIKSGKGLKGYYGENALEGKSKRASNPMSRVKQLISEDFFNTPRTVSDVRVELGNRGDRNPVWTLDRPLNELCKQKKLRRQKIVLDGKEFVYSYVTR